MRVILDLNIGNLHRRVVGGDAIELLDRYLMKRKFEDRKGGKS